MQFFAHSPETNVFKSQTNVRYEKFRQQLKINSAGDRQISASGNACAKSSAVLLEAFFLISPASKIHAVMAGSPRKDLPLPF
jgi:hypothetical protein